MDIGVKYSEKQERNFDDATMKAGQCVIGLQVGVGLSISEAHWAEGLLQPRPLEFKAALEDPSCPPLYRWAPTSVPASRA